MYNQFILEELKTLKDLLQAGAITQGEFDHLKQILIDGTKASGESVETGLPTEKTITGDVYENPDEVIRYYSNETKNLLLYKQFDKAYPFVQKILSLRPEHREANRFLQEIKTYIRRDYLIGGAIGVVVACILSAVLTLSKDVNLILLCVFPVLAGLLLPRLASSVLIGKVSNRGMRYLISAMTVIVIGSALNVALVNVFIGLEKGFNNTPGPIVDMGGTLEETAGNSEEFPFDSTQLNLPPLDTAQVTDNFDIKQDSQPQEPSVAVTKDIQESKPTKEETPIVMAENEDTKISSVRKILDLYYRDLSGQRFDADKYYARKVSKFFNMEDITPQTITQEIRNNYYTDFQNAVSKITPNSLEISQIKKNGMYQADFKEEIRCFRKSANQGQIITSRVKVIFDKNMKIVWYSSTPIATKPFGEGTDEKNVSKMVYFQDTNQ